MLDSLVKTTYEQSKQLSTLQKSVENLDKSNAALLTKVDEQQATIATHEHELQEVRLQITATFKEHSEKTRKEMTEVCF